VGTLKIHDTTNKDSPPSKKRKTVKEHQQEVDETQRGYDPQTSSNACMVEVGISEYPRTMDTGNPDVSLWVDELATNYIQTGKIFDRKATVVDTYFSKQVADILNDPDPKSLPECRKCSD
jgi:hypothetical protein